MDNIQLQKSFISKPSALFFKSYLRVVFLCQRVITVTSSPADESYCWPIDSVFNKLPVFMRQWEKGKVVIYPAEVPPP
jgi:hypothetical protein